MESLLGLAVLAVLFSSRVPGLWPLRAPVLGNPVSGILLLAAPTVRSAVVGFALVSKSENAGSLPNSALSPAMVWWRAAWFGSAGCVVSCRVPGLWPFHAPVLGKPVSRTLPLKRQNARLLAFPPCSTRFVWFLAAQPAFRLFHPGLWPHRVRPCEEKSSLVWMS